MWTETTRKKYARCGIRYASDMTHGEWRLIEPLLPSPRRLGCDSRMAGIFWDLSIYKFCAHSTIKPPLCVSLGSGCHFLRAIACGDRVWQSRRRRTGRT